MVQHKNTFGSNTRVLDQDIHCHCTILQDIPDTAKYTELWIVEAHSIIQAIQTMLELLLGADNANLNDTIYIWFP
jgi:hypothetical protein